ncbi:MAG: hypothetical protein QM538_07380, partial [Methylacidiphilales bacterium]|nr:hypothetical protein [Candidatus Methylacidiphilales bacterium]
TLSAVRSIINTTRTITSGVSGTISLTATNGSIGSSTNPISITQNATTGDLTATASNTCASPPCSGINNIYLRSLNSSLTLGAITGTDNNGTISISNVNFSGGQIIINGSSGQDIFGFIIRIDANSDIIKPNLRRAAIVSGSSACSSSACGSITLTSSTGSIGSTGLNNAVIVVPAFLEYITTTNFVFDASNGNIFLEYTPSKNPKISLNTPALNKDVWNFLLASLQFSGNATRFVSLTQTTGDVQVNRSYGSATAGSCSTLNAGGALANRICGNFELRVRDGAITFNSGLGIFFTDSITLIANNSITSTTNANATINSSSGVINLTSTLGSVGDNTNNLRIVQSGTGLLTITANCTSGCLTNSGNIYIISNSNINLGRIDSDSAGAYQANKNIISITTDAISNSSIFINDNIDANSISIRSDNFLKYSTSYESSAPSLTSRYSVQSGPSTGANGGMITLIATTGSIGTSSYPIRIFQNSTTNNLIATANGTRSSTVGNIYLDSIISTFKLGAITGSNIVSIDNCILVSSVCDGVSTRSINIDGGISAYDLRLITRDNINIDSTINSGTDVAITAKNGSVDIGGNINSGTIYSGTSNLTIDSYINISHTFLVGSPNTYFTISSTTNGTIDLIARTGYIGTSTIASGMTSIYVSQNSYASTHNLTARAALDINLQSSKELTIGNIFSFAPAVLGSSRKSIIIKIVNCTVISGETCNININGNIRTYLSDVNGAIPVSSRNTHTDILTLASDAGNLINRLDSANTGFLIEAYAFNFDFPNGSVGNYSSDHVQLIRISDSESSGTFANFILGNFKARVSGSSNNGIYISSPNNNVYSVLSEDNNGNFNINATGSIKFVNPVASSNNIIYLRQESGNLRSTNQYRINENNYGCTSVSNCDIYTGTGSLSSTTTNLIITLDAENGNITSTGFGNVIDLTVSRLILKSSNSIGTQSSPILTNDSLTVSIAGAGNGSAIYLRGLDNNLLNNASFFDYSGSTVPEHTISINKIGDVILNQSFDQSSFNFVSTFTFNKNNLNPGPEVLTRVLKTGLFSIEYLASGSTTSPSIRHHTITINPSITFNVENLVLHAKGDIINSPDAGTVVTLTVNKKISIISDYGSVGTSSSPIKLDFSINNLCFVTSSHATECSFVSRKNIYLEVSYDGVSQLFNTNNIFTFYENTIDTTDLTSRNRIVSIKAIDGTNIIIGDDKIGTSRTPNNYFFTDGEGPIIVSSSVLTNLTLSLDAATGVILGSQSSYSGSGVSYDIHANQVTLSAIGIYGCSSLGGIIQSNNLFCENDISLTKYPLVVQFDNPSIQSNLIITTTGQSNRGDIYFSSNLSINGSNITTHNSIQNIYVYQYSCSTAIGVSQAFCLGNGRIDDNYILTNYSSAAIKFLIIDTSFIPSVINSVGFNLDNIYITAENGNVINNSSDTVPGVLFGNKVSINAKGQGHNVGTISSPLIIYTKTNCPDGTIVDCSTFASNLTINSDSLIFVISDSVTSLIGTDDTTVLLKSFNFNSRGLTDATLSMYFRVSDFVYNKDKTCDTLNPNSGIPVLSSSPNPSLGGNCYDITITPSTYQSTIRNITLNIELATINQEFLVDKNKNGRQNPVFSSNIVYVHPFYNLVNLTTPGSVGTEANPFELPLSQQVSSIPVYNLNAGASFFAQTTGSCFDFNFTSNGSFYCKQLVGDINIPSSGLARLGTGYFNKLTLIASDGKIVSTGTGRILSNIIILEASGNIGEVDSPLYISTCSDIINGTCNFTGVLSNNLGELQIKFNSKTLSSNAPIVNITVDSDLIITNLVNNSNLKNLADHIATINPIPCSSIKYTCHSSSVSGTTTTYTNTNLNNAIININVTNNKKLTLNLPVSNFSINQIKTNFLPNNTPNTIALSLDNPADYWQLNVDGNILFNQNAINAHSFFISTSGDIGTELTPLFLELNSNGRFQIENYKSYGSIFIKSVNRDIFRLITDNNSYIYFCSPSIVRSSCNQITSADIDYRNLKLYQINNEIILVRNIVFSSNISLDLTLSTLNSAIASLDLSGFSITSGIVSININNGSLKQSNSSITSKIISLRESVTINVRDDIIAGPTQNSVLLPFNLLWIYTSSNNKTINITSQNGNIGDGNKNIYLQIGSSLFTFNSNISALDSIAIFSTNNVVCFISNLSNCGRINYTSTNTVSKLFLYQQFNNIVFENQINLLNNTYGSVTSVNNPKVLQLYLLLGQINARFIQQNPNQGRNQCSYVVSLNVANCSLTASKIYLLSNGSIGTSSNYLLVNTSSGLEIGGTLANVSYTPTNVYIASTQQLEIHNVTTTIGTNEVHISVYYPNNDLIIKSNLLIHDDYLFLNSQNSIFTESNIISVSQITINASRDIGASASNPFYLSLKGTNRTITIGQFNNVVTQPINIYLKNSAADIQSIIINGIFTNSVANANVNLINTSDGNFVINGPINTNDSVIITSTSNGSIVSNNPQSYISGNSITLLTAGNVGIDTLNPLYVITRSNQLSHGLTIGNPTYQPSLIYLSTNNTLYINMIQIANASSEIVITSTGLSSQGDIHLRGIINTTSQSGVQVYLNAGNSLFQDSPTSRINANQIYLNATNTIGTATSAIDINLIGINSKINIGTNINARPKYVFVNSSNDINIGTFSLSTDCAFDSLTICQTNISTLQNINFYNSITSNNAIWNLKAKSVFQIYSTSFNQIYLAFGAITLNLGQEIKSKKINNTSTDYFYVYQLSNVNTFVIQYDSTLNPNNSTSNYVLDIKLGSANVGAIISNLYIKNLLLKPVSNSDSLSLYGTVDLISYNSISSVDVVLDTINTPNYNWTVIASGSIRQISGSQLTTREIQLYTPRLIGSVFSTGNFNNNAFSISTKSIKIGNTQGTLFVNGNTFPVNPISVYLKSQSLSIDSINTDPAIGEIRLLVDDTVEFVNQSNTNDDWYIISNNLIRTNQSGKLFANSVFVWSRQIGSVNNPLFTNIIQNLYIGIQTSSYNYIDTQLPVVNDIYVSSDKQLTIGYIKTSSINSDVVSLKTLLDASQNGHDVILLNGALQSDNNDRLIISSSRDIISGAVDYTNINDPEFISSIYYASSFDFTAFRNIGTAFYNISKTSKLYYSILNQYHEKSLLFINTNVTNLETNTSVIIPITIQPNNAITDLSLQSNFVARYSLGVTVPDPVFPIFGSVYQNKSINKSINIFNIVNSANSDSVKLAQNSYVIFSSIGTIDIYNYKNNILNSTCQTFCDSFSYSNLYISSIATFLEPTAHILNIEENFSISASCSNVSQGCSLIPIKARTITMSADGRIGSGVSLDKVTAGINIHSSPSNNGLLSLSVTARFYNELDSNYGGINLASANVDSNGSKNDVFNLLPTRLQNNTFTWTGTGYKRLSLSQLQGNLLLDYTRINLPDYSLIIFVPNGSLLNAADYISYNDVQLLDFNNGGLSTSTVAKEYTFITGQSLVVNNLELHVSQSIGFAYDNVDLQYKNITQLSPNELNKFNNYIDLSGVKGTIKINTLFNLSQISNSNLFLPDTIYSTVTQNRQNILLLFRNSTSVDAINYTYDLQTIYATSIAIVGINSPTLKIGTLGAYSYYQNAPDSNTKSIKFDRGTDVIRIQGVGSLFTSLLNNQLSNGANLSNLNARRIDIRTKYNIGTNIHPLTIGLNSFGGDNFNQVIFFNLIQKPYVESTKNNNNNNTFSIKKYDERNIVRILWVHYNSISTASISEFIAKTFLSIDSYKKSIQSLPLSFFKSDIFSGSEFIEGLLTDISKASDEKDSDLTNNTSNSDICQVVDGLISRSVCVKKSSEDHILSVPYSSNIKESGLPTPTDIQPLTQPTTPSDTAQPAIPSDAAQPAIPSDAAQPAIPSDAAQPATPSDAAQPAIPSDAAQPAIPSDA